MKRIVSPSSAGGVDIGSAVKDSEYRLAVIMYLCGMNPQDIDSTEIDDVVNNVKKTFSGRIRQDMPFAANMFNSRIRWSNLISLRWEWRSRKLLKDQQ